MVTDTALTFVFLATMATPVAWWLTFRVMVRAMTRREVL